MSKDEALDLALEALDNLLYWDNGKPEYDEAREAITAIKQARSAPVQEPVAWRYTDARGHYCYRGYVPGFDAEYQLLKPEALCLCTPPAQPAVPLTDEQIESLWDHGMYVHCGGITALRAITHAIEAHHGITKGQP